MSSAHGKFGNYFPQFMVFMSGLGFAVQGLYIGILAHKEFSNSFQILFFRGIFQIAFSAPFVYQNYKDCNDRGEIFSLIGNSWEVRRVLMLSCVFVFLGLSFLFLALDNISLSYAMVIDRQSTLFNAAFAYIFLREPWLPMEFVAAMISILGVFFVAQPKEVFGEESTAHDDGNGNHTLGFVFGILGAIFSAACFTTLRALGTSVKLHWANVIFLQSIVVSILSIPTIYLTENSYELVSPKIGGFIIAGCLIGALGQIVITIGNLVIFRQPTDYATELIFVISMTLGLQLGKAATTSVMGTSQILFGFILQALFTDDVINYLSIIGGLLVLIGIVLMILMRSNGDAAEEALLMNKERGKSETGTELSDASTESNPLSDHI